MRIRESSVVPTVSKMNELEGGEILFQISAKPHLFASRFSPHLTVAGVRQSSCRYCVDMAGSDRYHLIAGCFFYILGTNLKPV